MNFHRIVTVRFVSQTRRTLNVNVNGNGTVKSVPAGINAQCGAQNMCIINMNADKNCTANFSQAANNPPVINQFSADPQSGPAPLTVTFTCYLDIDNDGTNEYTVNNCETSPPQYTVRYNNPGNYTAKFTVSDGQHSTSATTTVNVTSGTTIDMTGVWEGTYQGNDGSSGQICVELQQTNGNLTGDLYIAGRGYAGSVNGTVSGGNVTFGTAGGVQYSGTVDPNNNTASGTYDEDGDEQSDGTWQVTKTDKESCGWGSDIVGDISEFVTLPFSPGLITEVPILTVDNNGNTENDWYAVVVEYTEGNQVHS